MAYDFGLGDSSSWGLGNNSYDFSVPASYSSIGNYGMGNLTSGSLSSLFGNSSNDFSSALTNGGATSSVGNGLGLNIPTAQLALSGLNSLASLWSGLQSSNLAKQQFDYTKSITNKNLANSVQSYNTSLSDRANARGVAEGQTQDQIDAYIAANKLST